MLEFLFAFFLVDSEDIKKISNNLNVLVNEKQKLNKVSSSYIVFILIGIEKLLKRALLERL